MPITAASPSAPPPTPVFILDPILPTRSVNLLGGRSGSGKTTLLLQLLESWESGQEFFGATSHPVPWCYVACAKPAEAILQTAARIGYGGTEGAPRRLPVVSLRRDRLQPSEEPTIEAALRAARLAVPDVRFLILDGIGILCRGRVTEYNVVADFMSRLLRIALTENLTILGLGPMAKAGSETPRASRELFLGSVAWGEHAETMILIDKDDPSDPKSSLRTVTILPTNAPSQVLNFDFDKSGRLVQTTDESLQETLLDARLDSLSPGSTFTSDDLLTWAREFNCSRATAYRWMDRAIAEGKVERVKRGVYRVTEKAKISSIVT